MRGGARFHDAVTATWVALDLGRSIRKYLRKNGPSRPASEPPQEIHTIGAAGSLKASIQASEYFAPQPQTNRSEFCVSELRIKGADTSSDTRACRDGTITISPYCRVLGCRLVFPSGFLIWSTPRVAILHLLHWQRSPILSPISPGGPAAACPLA